MKGHPYPREFLLAGEGRRQRSLPVACVSRSKRWSPTHIDFPSPNGTSVIMPSAWTADCPMPRFAGEIHQHLANHHFGRMGM